MSALCAFAALAEARLSIPPQPTVAADYALEGISPKPTAAPGVHELLKRQSASGSISSDTTVLVAPDNTCGFISGRPGAAYSCGVGGTCLFLTAEAPRTGNVACCDGEDCNFRATCIDYDQYYTQSICDDGCKVDAYTTKCIGTDYPYCNTVSFRGGIVDYWCNGLNISVPQAASTTYDGQTGRSFMPVVLSDETSSSLILSPTSSEVVPGPTTDPNGDNGSTGNSGNTGNNGNNGDSGSTGDSGSSQNKDNGGGSSTPIGAIVGGVVGGVAVLALIGVALWWFLRKKKGNKQQPQPQPQAQEVYPPMEQKGQHPYDPNGGFGGYQQQQQHAASPPQSYGQPPGFYAVPGQHPSPDPLNPHSSTASQFTDPRTSYQGASPSSSYGGSAPPPGGYPNYQPQGAVIHEVPAQTGDNHRGQMHELG